MSENKVSETRLREQQELAAEARARRSPEQSSGHLVWKIVGGMALAVAATTLITSLHDIRRYIRISRM
ncbi:MAG: hypothetical protein M3R69_03365 [Acidobacteriota bacterium]|nr:hypothetical protein [Acidobacteriota bacterium]